MLNHFKYIIYLCFFVLAYLMFLPSDTPDNAAVTADLSYLSDTYTDFRMPDAYDDIKKVALTFDDGPHSATTPALLDGLRERNIKATFFIIGKKAAENPDIITQMYKDGHLIGNHTNTHCQLNTLSCDNALKDIDFANEIIYQITGSYTDYLRPPFGEFSDTLESSLNMFEVLWDVDPRDWSVQNTKSVVNYVVANINDGDIILLHDIFDTSVEAALEIVDILTAKGYQFVTVDEILFP